MDIWHIRGENRLAGSCTVQGSKNASLPIIAASVISPCRTVLKNVPRLSDVDAAMSILRELGCTARQEQDEVYINSSGLCASEIPRPLMARMRSSVIFMGALIARCRKARLSMPGGCRLGKRPIDMHLAALREMGVKIEENSGDIICRADKLHGAEVYLPFPSVGATENIMLAAVGAEGRTVIHGAAREPEIRALQDFLCELGADVRGAGSGTIEISGLEARGDVSFTVMPDRIAAATLACAAAATGGNVEMRGAEATHFSTVLHFLNRAGCDIIQNHDKIRIKSEHRLNAVGALSTEPYPGFPTDAQPLLMAALLRSVGETRITETIFDSRFRQAPELIRLGADIMINDSTAIIRGVDSLHGAELHSTDLRGGAAMIIAALSAQGETLIYDEGHIKRGYDGLDRRLRSLGADIYIEETEQ